MVFNLVEQKYITEEYYLTNKYTLQINTYTLHSCYYNVSFLIFHFTMSIGNSLSTFT